MKHYTAVMASDLFGAAEVSAGVTHNLFFGLVPDEATCAALSRTVGELRARHETGGRWVDASRYHMTLHYLGAYSEVPPALVDDACAAAAGLRARAFDVVVDRTGHFPHGVGWLGSGGYSEGLQALWEGLRGALARAHVKVQGHAAFKPHVTVLRDARTPLPQHAIEPVRWSVREFVLIDSQLGRRSAYVRRGAWPLVT